MAMITTGMSMNDQSLLRLLTWLSPAFPVGAFAYSHGLEQAIDDGAVTNRESLTDWIDALITLGSGWSDAVLVAAAWRASGDERRLRETADLAQALTSSAERQRETLAQGASFLVAIRRTWPSPLLEPLGRDTAYPVAVGAVAAAHGVDVAPALAAYLHAFVANLIGVALRLIPLGQTEGVAALGLLEQAILSTAKRAAASSLDDLGTATLVSDIMAMRHETQTSRIFIS